MTPFRRIALFFSLLAPSAALAQTEPAGMMPTTVVTADRFPTDPDKVTSSYTVVMQEEMQRRQLRSAGEVSDGTLPIWMSPEQADIVTKPIEAPMLWAALSRVLTQSGRGAPAA